MRGLPGAVPFVLVFCADYIPSVHVGVASMLEYLSKQGVLRYEYRATGRVRAGDVSRADTVICVRGTTWQEYRIMRLAEKLEKHRVYFLDDDLAAIPPGVASYEKAGVEAAAAHIPQILSCCHTFWSTSPNLIAKYGAHCESSVLMDAPALICPPRKFGGDRSRITVAFAGSADHAGFLVELLAPVFDRLYARYREGIRICIIGGPQSGFGDNPAISYIPYFKSLSDYRKAIERLEIDIGLAPIRDTPFYRCKYFNKYLEYGALGICGIYSDTEPYSFVIQNRKNGLLVQNDSAKWEEAIAGLVDNIDSAREMAASAYEHVTQAYSVEALSAHLLEKIPNISHFFPSPPKVRIFAFAAFNINQTLFVSRFMNGVDKYGWRIVPEILKRIYRKLAAILNRDKERL